MCATKIQRDTARSTFNVWATETMEKCKFQFKPLRADEREAETTLSVKGSGSFPGSPVTLDYRFTLADEKIQSLIMDS